MARIFMIGMSTDKGGVEAYISNLCCQLEGRYEIIHRLPQMEIDGVTWVCPKNRHNYLRYRRFWKKFFQTNYFDAIYYNTCDIVSIDMLRFAKAVGIPVRIIHSHNTDNQMRMTLFHRVTEWINRRVIRRYATDLFACSQDAGRWMFGGQPFSVIKNGIDLCRFAFSEEARRRCRDLIGEPVETVVGYVGRLDPQKNPLFTIKIAEVLSRKMPDIRVVLIGDGELRAQVEREVKHLNIQNRVTLLGARNDVDQWYSAFDCLLMPSLFEGLPFVLVEAQAAGLPCVVSSTVSKDADLTGLLTYVGLEQPPEVWADHVLVASQKPRVDKTQRLIDAGYSIENTVREVAGTIDSVFGEKHD